jgi:hypothetical protein
MSLLARTKDLLNMIFGDAGSVMNVGLKMGDYLDSLDTASHTHSNKTTLDAVSAAFTTALKSSYDGMVTNGLTKNAINGTFVTADVVPQTITVVDGQITSIV